MSSPFNRNKGGTAAVKAAPAKAAAAKVAKADADDPTKAEVVNLGEDKPLPTVDPFNAADPTGISAYKPIAFMDQLVLMHPTETGKMKTSANNAENPESEFVRFDIIALTVPQPPEDGTITRTPAVAKGDVFAVMNKDGDVETFEPYEVGERLDDVLVFNKPLVREGKKALDNGTSWILGRIKLGNKKQGQSPPVIIVAGDEEDKALYQEWRNAVAAR